MRKTTLSSIVAGTALWCLAVSLLALTTVNAADFGTATNAGDNPDAIHHFIMPPLAEKVLAPEEVMKAEAAANLVQTQSNMSVPLYGQCWSPWSGDQLGTCNLTICDAGCAITSTAMCIAYYGVSCDPRSMNNYMKSHGGYEGGCNEIWEVPAGISGGSVTYAGGYDCSNIPCDMNVVNAELDNGYPCVTEVRLFGGMHFVCCTGHDGGTYYINDPAYGDRTTLNARYGTPTAAIYSVQKYHGYVAPPTPAYAATYAGQSYPSTMTAGTTATAWAEYTNTGTAVWGHAATNLGTSGPQDRSSPFYNSGNWISAARPSNVDQSAVSQGQVGRFTFILKAPSTPGVYVEKYRPVQEGVTWFGGEVTWTITVTASNGNITGTVRNSSNSQPIPGATVAISGGPSTTTNGSGVYLFTGLAPTTYTLNVSAAGFGSASGTAAVTAGATTTKDFSLTSTDHTAPTAPSGLAATGISPSQIDLSWTLSTDSGGAGLAGYIVYRGSVEVGRTASTTYSDNGLTQNTTYSYYVKAYDNANNVSGQSNTASANTKPGTVAIFQDGFASIDGNLWQAIVQSPMPGANPLVLSGAQNHGTFAGVNSILTVDSTNSNQGCLLGHTFDPGFGAAKFESWFYDSSANNNSRQGMEVRCLDNNGGVKGIYYIGTYSAAPGAFGSYSAGYYKVCGSGCTAWYWPLAASRARAIGWHKFTLDFQPYTTAGAASAVHAYIDDIALGTMERTIDTQTYGLKMIAYGYHYRVNQQGWFDDCAMYASPPAAPSIVTPTVLSTSAIRWNITDNSNNEIGFKVVNAAQATVASAGVSNETGGGVSMDEGGLAANTSYTRSIKAFNGTLDSLPTGNTTRWTLPVAPSTSNVTCDRAVGSCSPSPDFTFTAVGGFGQGTVAYYRYAWDTNPTRAWSDSEATWNSGALILSATSSGYYYLHVKSYNGENVANGTLDLGPYGYQAYPLADKISSLWPLEDGAGEWLQSKPVTATFAGAFYIEETDRTAGIKVVSGATVARGDLVNVEGTLGLSGVQRAFIATYVEKKGTATVPKPLFTTTRALGGSSPYDQTPGVTDGRSLYNVGLLMRASGNVAYSDSTDPSNKFFYLDDGCGVSDGSGHPGVLVRCGSVSPPRTGMVAVTGVVGLEQAGKRYVPVIIIRDGADISVF